MSNNNNKLSNENHRFWLAILFIGGFLVIMFTALLGTFFQVFTGIKDLAAIFSGWITAVLAFYFLQSNTEKAQEQTSTAILYAEEARKAAHSATRCIPKLTIASEATVEEFQSKSHKYEEKIKLQQQEIQILLEKIEEIMDRI